MSIMKQFPVDTIKVDRSFVRDLEKNAGSRHRVSDHFDGKGAGLADRRRGRRDRGTKRFPQGRFLRRAAGIFVQQAGFTRRDRPIREDLLLRIMDIVEAAGTGFAFPSQTLYLGRDTGVDKEKAERAALEVQKWRESNRLPFPDFDPTDISEISNSLPYPQPGSAVGSRKGA